MSSLKYVSVQEVKKKKIRLNSGAGRRPKDDKRGIIRRVRFASVYLYTAVS